MDPVVIVLLAGALGAALRCVLGYLGEAEEKEGFDAKKLAKTLARGIVGGVILVYFLSLDPKAAFFTAFLADVASKNVWDIIQEK